jgi:hypothetical protein
MPLLCSAQDTHQIDGDLDQILDLVMAVAKIPGTPECRQSIFDAALAGLHRPGIWCPRQGEQRAPSRKRRGFEELVEVGVPGARHAARLRT